MPALRDRVDDIPALARAFLHRHRPANGDPEFDDGVHRLIMSRDYPGNVRDLRQFVNRMAKRHVGPGPITVGDVPPEERIAGPAPVSDRWDGGGLRDVIRTAIGQRVGLKDISRRSAEVAIELAIAEEGGSLTRAAKRLGVTARALQLRRAAQRSGNDAGPDEEPD
jgi:DNA-binding NtrC family response regulator